MFVCLRYFMSVGIHAFGVHSGGINSRRELQILSTEGSETFLTLILYIVLLFSCALFSLFVDMAWKLGGWQGHISQCDGRMAGISG